MRILFAIANFGESSLAFLREVVASIRSMSHDVDIVVDTTVPLAIDGIEQRIYGREIERQLPFQHRKLFTRRQNHYDLFVYLENDVRVTQDNIDAYLDVTARLPSDYITGFLRYELLNSQRHLIDLRLDFPVVFSGRHFCNGVSIFCPANPHSGCYLLTRSQLRRVLKSGGYMSRPLHGGMALEHGASDVYYQCGFRHKVFPEEFEPLLVHRLPNKYVHLPGVYTDPGHVTVEAYKEMLRSHHPIEVPCTGVPSMWEKLAGKPCLRTAMRTYWYLGRVRRGQFK